VGGHCIGVDPYYLTHRAQQAGFEPEVILAGRSINDSMGKYVAHRVIDLIKESTSTDQRPRVLILGATFKENCPDIRNSKVIDVIEELQSRGVEVAVVDPLVDDQDRASFGSSQWLSLDEVFPNETEQSTQDFNAVVLAVAHSDFMGIQGEIRNALRPGGIVFDVKGKLPDHIVDSRL